MRRLMTVGLMASLVAVAGFVVGVRQAPVATGVRFVADVPPAMAACQPANTACSPGDNDKTSTLSVEYKLPLTTWIEPGSTTSWQIVATWNDNFACGTTTETATVDVSWNGTAWALANVYLTGGIVGIAVCGSQTCSSANGTHSATYVLRVSVTDPYDDGSGVRNLRKVVYTTTNVPNGNDINTSPCTLGTSRSPDSQTFSATDEPGNWNSGRCPYTCNVGGTSVTISYH